MNNRQQRIIHLLFDIGVIGKGIDGLLEILGGFLLLWLNPEHINSTVQALTQHELHRNSHDILIHLLKDFAAHFSADQTFFISAYLFCHGFVKVGLVIALLLKRLWAYPLALVIFAIFFIYQLYTYFHLQSPWMAALCGVDLFVIALTWLEYKRLQTLPSG